MAIVGEETIEAGAEEEDMTTTEVEEDGIKRVEIEEEVEATMEEVDQMRKEIGIEEQIRSTLTLLEIQTTLTSIRRMTRKTMDSLTPLEVAAEVITEEEATIVAEETIAAEVNSEVEEKGVAIAASEAGKTMSKETKRPLALSLLRTSSSITRPVRRNPAPTIVIEDLGTATLMISSTRRVEWATRTR